MRAGNDITTKRLVMNPEPRMPRSFPVTTAEKNLIQNYTGSMSIRTAIQRDNSRVPPSIPLFVRQQACNYDALQNKAYCQRKQQPVLYVF